MSFVSLEFFVLFGALLLCFAFLRGSLSRRLLVLLVSCVFYAWSDWRFLALLATVTTLDYFLVQRLASSSSPRWRLSLLIASITVNLGFLFAFKYFRFFIDNLHRLGLPGHAWDLALPIGISFYTFESLSYVIDVYRLQAQPARSFLDYAVFLTFFPRLVAGPIMRASHFLPQLERGLLLSAPNFALGAQLFAQGAVKKMVFADGLAVFIDPIYRHPERFSPEAVWAAVFCYSFQILCDFSGYTDMAMGIARILGIQLPPNFDLPYTAQSLSEFWRRWHISLSTWLRDYLYIPLGGNRHAALRTAASLFLTMLLGGLWHGAGWNFILWGALHGLYLTFERLLPKSFRDPSPWTSPVAYLRASLCFTLVTLTWTLFRAPHLSAAKLIWQKLLFLQPGGETWIFWPAPPLAALLFFGALLQRRFPAFSLPTLPPQSPLLPAYLLAAALAVAIFAPLHSSPFIYFRF